MSDRAALERAARVRELRGRLVLRKLQSMTIEQLVQLVVAHIARCDKCTMETPCLVGKQLVDYAERRAANDQMLRLEALDKIPRQPTYQSRDQLAQISAVQGHIGLRGVVQNAIQRFNKKEKNEDV